MIVLVILAGAAWGMLVYSLVQPANWAGWLVNLSISCVGGGLIGAGLAALTS